MHNSTTPNLDAISALASQFGPVAYILPIISILALVAYVIVSWRIFSRAGKMGFLSLIPFVNIWVTSEIIYGQGWKLLLMLIPGIGWIFALPSGYRLCQAFGKTDVPTVIMMYIPFINIYALYSLDFYKGPNTDCFL